MLNAAELSPILNAYAIRIGPPKQIIVPRASTIAPLRDVSVAGTLLRKQVISIGEVTEKRTVSPGTNGGAYGIEADGDLHFCLGTQPLQPHITCELQHARSALSLFQSSVGQDIVAGGLVRCLFEHPGFAPNDDAHIFEVHPVTTVTLGGQPRSFSLDLPEPASIHTWTSPHDLNVQDDRIQVEYDQRSDTLTFTGMDGSDENYVRVGGTISNVVPDGAGSAFTLTSPDISHPLRVRCLPGTNAAAQLAALTTKDTTMVVLRSIDLIQALGNHYVIELLAIDIQPAAAAVGKRRARKPARGGSSEPSPKRRRKGKP